MISIYKITHKETGKCYIGQAQDVERRWKLHCSTSSKCPKIKNAIQKYGVDAFDFKVLTTVKEESADDLETFLIKAFRCVEHGYNICPEGGTRRGVNHSAEAKQKMSDAQKGEKHHNYGKTLSENTKKKLSEYMKGKRTGETNPNYGKTGEKNPNSKLTDAQREEIKALYATGEYSTRQLGKLYSISQRQIYIS